MNEEVGKLKANLPDRGDRTRMVRDAASDGETSGIAGRTRSEADDNSEGKLS